MPWRAVRNLSVEKDVFAERRQRFREKADFVRARGGRGVEKKSCRSFGLSRHKEENEFRDNRKIIKKSNYDIKTRRLGPPIWDGGVRRANGLTAVRFGAAPCFYAFRLIAFGFLVGFT